MSRLMDMARLWDAIRLKKDEELRELVTAMPSLVNELMPPYDTPPISLAITALNVFAVRLFCELGADFSACFGTFNRGAVHHAAERRNIEIAEIILSHGADMDVLDGYGERTPLGYAAAQGDLDMVKLFLASGANVNYGFGDAETSALFSAVLEEQTDVVQHLLDHGATMDIFSAVFMGSVDWVRGVLGENPESVRARHSWHTFFWTRRPQPIHLAVDKGIDVVDALLDLGADIHSETSTGLTPVCVAAMKHALDSKGRSAMVEHLLERGAAIDVATAVALEERELLERLVEKESEVRRKNVALCVAVMMGLPDSVKLLLDCGAEAHATMDENGESAPLSLALKTPRVDNVKMLLEHGADANGRTPERRGDSPPLVNVGYPFYSIGNAGALLDFGADPNAMSMGSDGSKGQAMLHVAVGDATEDMIRLLLSKGADPNLHARNRYGFTPLHAAVNTPMVDDCTAMVKLLLASGARVDEVDSVFGESPGAWAEFDLYPKKCSYELAFLLSTR